MFKSIKIKLAIAASLLVIIIISVYSLVSVMTRREQLKKEIQAGVISFAQMTVAPICQNYYIYYTSGYFKFRGLLANYFKMNDNITEIQIIDVNGVVMFDSRQMDTGRSGIILKPESYEPDLMERVKRLDLSHKIIRIADNQEIISVVMPYIGEWGRHRLSVRFVGSFAALGYLARSSLNQVLITGVIFVLLGSLLAYFMAKSITDPIHQLTVAARDIGAGKLDHEVDVKSDDEIGSLADNFNIMTRQLKVNLEALSESYDRLSQANAELMELDRLKSNFIANVSHELKTPLTTISGYADYLAMEKLGPLTETQRKGIEVMRRNIKRLTRQIKDLLDFITIESGHFIVEQKPFDIRTLFDEAAANYQAELDKKKLKLIIEAPEALNVVGDRERILQVVDNLVMNALKFTSKGHINLTAEAGPDGKARIEVSDTGVGIPRESVPRIFERFHQLDGSSTRKYGGVGLGLAIVKSILDAHQSTVEVTSQSGKGSRFTFKLPLE
ncbi:MAG: HAMP domain-containing histidine kinase [Candidatus Edwardsbacteria bacterium]|nr:HAMP domain-containing histidine kinase [Candidatus Edwardsbacteria bacterium]MBU1575608.1 HAMP domain-containing histidine kinase [Candidatus Edwardsbacteria bacterium]MBU2462642.1 HAMP domain-containing histidine kinase [Candidatus Edwardsbacteria bacterium]MBU2594425.1 HAMP domain-containing histidine kinase [Candidatus Edwardsbacteria bacterium]